MKKILIALTVVSAVALAACGSSTPTTETPAGDSTSAASATPAATGDATAAPTASAEAK